MKTDLAFTEMFSHNPGWLGELAGLDLPEAAEAGPVKFKGIEREADLVLRPKDQGDPHYLVEFQMQLDNSIYARLTLYQSLHWLSIHDPMEFARRSFQQAEIRGIVLFGTRNDQPEHLPVPGNTVVLFLDELVESLRKRNPGSPLLPALAPLTEKASVLESQAKRFYSNIQKNQQIGKQARNVLLDIFEYFLYQRFNSKTNREIQSMIAKLTPLNETRAGQELIEQGIEQRNREIVMRMNAQGMDVEQIVSVMGIPKEKVLQHLAAG